MLALYTQARIWFMIDSWRDTIFFLGVVVLFPLSLSLSRALIERPAKEIDKRRLTDGAHITRGAHE